MFFFTSSSIVDSPGRFSFLRVPYAASATAARFEHSRLASAFGECHEGTLKAHSHPNTTTLADSKCIRRYPDGTVSGNDDSCLTLDLFTGSVVYEDLAPVVVFVAGDDLNPEEEERVRPSSGNGMVLTLKFISFCEI